MTEQNRLDDQSADRKYFTIIPQVVWAIARDPYELALWCVVKMIAGDEGECYISTDDLATLAMMSTGKVSQCRKRLLSTGLLAGELRRDPGYPQPVWHLVIPDLWRLNLEWREELGHSLKKRIELKQEQRNRRREAGRNKREQERERKKSLHTVKAPKEPSHSETKDNHVLHDNDNNNKAYVEQMFANEIGVITPLIQERLTSLLDQYPDQAQWDEAFDGVVRSNVRRLDYLEACLRNVGKPKWSRPR